MTDPAKVVQRQVDAANAHDLDAYLACWHENAVIIDGAGEWELRGRAMIRAASEKLFAAGRSRADVVHRIAAGDWVVDDELVYGLSEDPVAVEPEHALVTYRVVDGVITESRVLS